MRRVHPYKSTVRTGGFALVVSLSLMVLMTLIAVGLLGLASIQLRKSTSEQSVARAKANARLALMIALGELQETLGPDQRVSADARVVHGPSGNPAHPQWLSAWKTTRDNGTPWIVRAGEKGGLQDRRISTSWDAESARITCLVSGNETSIRYSDKDSNIPDAVTLVDVGTLGAGSDESDRVVAPRVAMESDEGHKGAYAWWISDLGTKANLATDDGKPSSGRRHHEMLAGDQSIVPFGREDLETGDRVRLVSEGQVALTGLKQAGRHFHDITVWSAAMPVNVREGGWKRDLTAYLESDGNIPAVRIGGSELLGLSDSDNLAGPANSRADALSGSPRQATRLEQVSPNFGVLRDWAKRSVSVAQGKQSLEMETAQLIPQSTGGRNTKSVDYKNRTRTHLMPVIVEGSLYYNLSYFDPPRPNPSAPHQLRLHFYPRVALWNPYNFPLKVPDSAVFLHINGSKSVEITLGNKDRSVYRMYWGLQGGAERGSMFFRLTGATLQAGETLVWSPSRNQPYSENDFSQNLLSPDSPPHATRSLYQDTRSDGLPLFKPEKGGTGSLASPNMLTGTPQEWREIVPPRPSGNIQDAAWTQADDYFISWKPLTGPFKDVSSFANLPMGRFVSCAYQYGDEDEFPVEWTARDMVPIARSSLANPMITAVPDRRTRDGFRLRWFEETASNVLGSGSLANLPHMEDSPIGNWNLRASWAFRNPFDNVTDVAPHFFGIYTRDLFDGDVSWNGMNPRFTDGRALGSPFDQPSRSPKGRILFDVPRRGAEIASLGAFQHANFSEFVWHPTYALGNSLADPRVDLDKTEPDRSNPINRDKGGWNQDSIGYSTDGRSDTNGGTNRTNEDNWAYHARDFLQQVAIDQNLIYDLSYELNHSIWDSYFLSSGSAADKAAFIRDPLANGLPNTRIRLNPMMAPPDTGLINHFQRSAPYLLTDGAFNVNSASASAWESLLLSGLGRHGSPDAVAFPRVIDPPGGDWDGTDAESEGAWMGRRTYSRAEIRRLAEAIAEEVRIRGPFLGMADFVNRRLANDATGLKGTLQAAIDRSGLNQSFETAWPLDNGRSLPNYRHMDHIKDPTRLEQTRKPDSTAWGALGFLTQADLLQAIGPALTPRSDSFRIRAYGEDVDPGGRVLARAWCEAVVQRSPDYVDEADHVLEGPTTLTPVNRKFGRRFEVIAFRWLAPEEV